MARLNTKESRLKVQQAQIEHLLSKGWKKEEYKELILMTEDATNGYYLKVFRGTAAHAEQYTVYHSAERRAAIIEEKKKSFDRWQSYKEEAKKNKKASTAANCAAAIREELKKVFPGVKFSVTSSNFSMGNSVDIRWEDGPKTDEVTAVTGKYQYGHFDGMTDSYEYTNDRDDIPQAKYVQTQRSMSEATREKLMPHAEEIYNSHDFGCLDAGNLLHRIFYNSSIPAAATITGIERNENCTCGQVQDFYKIAYTTPESEQKAPAQEIKETAPVEVPADEVQIISYSEKAIAVIGNFSPYYDKLIAAGGAYNPRLKCGRGIIFSKKRLDDVLAILQPEEKEPAPVVNEPEPVQEPAKVVQMFSNDSGEIYADDFTQELANLQNVLFN